MNVSSYFTHYTMHFSIRYYLFMSASVFFMRKNYYLDWKRTINTDLKGIQNNFKDYNT